ncbi:hypothetical protein Clacol_004865 [Clathrus columnatus]|uniref:Uncharacterized protein n=1 Tax=Clathrus columnatus TaxID=1419009 RepID=A0AAV5AAY6_9AGAM|nr:hypothetical protein Clacol_004865 [Clathrus columnatus]
MADPPRKHRKLNLPAQPIHSMFTAPPIPSLSQCREEFVDEDSKLACRNMEGTVTLVVTTQFTILPQLGRLSQQVPVETWSDNWTELLQLYNPNQLGKHVWDWEGTQLVPHYDLQPVKTFENAWKENIQGLNGFLPFQILQERWGNSNPGWHRNDGAKKTPSSRRKKVTDFIEKLSLCPHWTVQQALRFLQTHCTNMTVDKIARNLKDEYLEKLMAAIKAKSSTSI